MAKGTSSGEASATAVLEKPLVSHGTRNGVAEKPRPEDDPSVQRLAKIIEAEQAKGRGVDDARAEDAEKSRDRVRNRNGRFAPKASDDDDDDTATAEPEEKPAKASAGESEVEIPDEDYRSAVRALARDGWDKEQIDLLAEKDISKLIATGKRRAKAQADGDDFTKKHRTIQQELNALKNGVQPGPNKSQEANEGDSAEKPKNPKGVTTQPVASDSTEEPVTDVRAFTDYLEKTVGVEGAAEPVQKAFGALDKRSSERIAGVMQAIQDRDKQLVSVMDGMNSILNDTLLRLSIKELEVEFPDLKRADFRTAVLKEASELGFSDSRPDHESLLRYAVMVVDAPTRWKKAKAHVDRVKEARRNGSPTPPRSVEDSPTRKLNQDQLRTEMLRAKFERDESKYADLKAEYDKRFHRA